MPPPSGSRRSARKSAVRCRRRPAMWSPAPSPARSSPARASSASRGSTSTGGRNYCAASEPSEVLFDLGGLKQFILIGSELLGLYQLADPVLDLIQRRHRRVARIHQLNHVPAVLGR